MLISFVHDSVPHQLTFLPDAAGCVGGGAGAEAGGNSSISIAVDSAGLAKIVSSMMDPGITDRFCDGEGCDGPALGSSGRGVKLRDSTAGAAVSGICVLRVWGTPIKRQLSRKTH
jgi:hypothetical protein